MNRTLFCLMALSATLVMTMCTILIAGAQDLPEFQKVPITLKTSEHVPKNLLKGSNYRIEANAKNDGFINTYRLTTNYGRLKIEGTYMLMERINELRALSHMEEIEQTETFAKALGQSATGPVNTVKGLVTEPGETVSGIASGVGSWFEDVGNAITSDDPHQEGALSAAVGYAAARRKFAFAYGINPYSRYEPVQDQLNKMARAAVAGGLTPKVAFSMIQSPVGTVLQVTGTADTMRKLVRDKSPAELNDINRGKLKAMGVEDSIANDFLKNPYFDPQEETLMVGELESMKNVKDRKKFIKMAAVAPNYRIARFLHERAKMMAIYNKKVARVERIVAVQGIPLVQRKDGVIIILAPLDYLAWTRKLWLKEGGKGSGAFGKLPGFSGKEVWITGTFDPVARKALEIEGWKVKQNFEIKNSAKKK